MTTFRNLDCTECQNPHEGHPECLDLKVLHNVTHDLWSYRYRCPRTGTIQVNPASIETIHKMTEQGVGVQHWHNPVLSHRPVAVYGLLDAPGGVEELHDDRAIQALIEQGY